MTRIESLIRNIPDFPKPGILFKDITPMLGDAQALAEAVEALRGPYADARIDQVVGMESRGFLLGPALAIGLKAGFVPVRKPGKLPAATLSESYELEYGTDSVEIHADAIRPGQRVLIHDDVVATGGTAMAATRLVQRLGGVVVGYSFLIELSFLPGADTLRAVAPVHSLMRV